jgi:hypothetical protein
MTRSQKLPLSSHNVIWRYRAGWAQSEFKSRSGHVGSRVGREPLWGLARCSVARRMADPELVTLFQIAAMFAVPRELAGRLVRSEGFPAPSEGRTWSRPDVEAWGRKIGRLAAKTD